MVRQTKKYTSELLEAKSTMARLARADAAVHTAEYFQNQWDRQRALQLKAINVKAKEKRERLAVLLTLEEDLLEAR